MVTNDVLFVVTLVTVLLFSINIVIFSYLAFKRKKEERFQQKVNRYIVNYEHHWYGYLLGGEPIERTLHHNHFDSSVQYAIDKIFISYVTTVNNVEVRANISRFIMLNMQDYYKKMLKSSEWANRLNVLRRTLLFDLQFLVPIIETKLKRDEIRGIEEYMVVLQVMAKYNPNLFLAHFYKPRMEMTEYDYKVTLAHVDDSYIKIFIHKFDDLPIHLQLSLLDYLGLYTTLDSDYLHFYESLLNTVHKEFRIRALKAIHTFGMVGNLSVYDQFLTSQEWEERLMLAKVLRLVEGDEAIKRLQMLLCDTNWRIRRQAAMTLKSKKNGVNILQEMANQTDDMFAADMAKEVLGTR